MFRKTVSALFAAVFMIVGASAAGTIFPVSKTDIDGVTLSGYLDEDGETVLPFAYAEAGEFADCGLAAVENDQWQTAVIDRTGAVVIPYAESPVSVDFSDEMVAYRYADRCVYYTTVGAQVGSYAGAQGFFHDGLLLCKSPASGLYSYVTEDGKDAFPGGYADAGEFSGGVALVRETGGIFRVIDTDGETRYTLPADASPAAMTVENGDTVVLQDGSLCALYSLSQGAYLTDFLYNTVSDFHDGVAMVRQLNRWGMIQWDGKLLTSPTYYYLSYMGDGLYAARSEDGSASAVDENGNLAYRTLSYVGGFNELHYGLSWHGTDDGTLIFFRKNGGYFASIKKAENPTLLSRNVVRVTQDGTTKYINLSNGKTLFAQPTTFDLGSGVTAKTTHYERFLGYQADGGEYGWNVDFPEITGLPDEAVQKNINSAIRAFFLEGPSVTADYEALEGGYGASIEGSVLVVWANCVSGKGAGATVWNNSLAFNLNTGTQYKLSDLLTGDYIAQVRSLLPEDHALYLYSFPRMSAEGVTYFYNEYESKTRRAYTESYLLTFDELGDAVNRTGECYAALHTPYTRIVTVAGFQDVPVSYWAADYIQQVRTDQLMVGDTNGLFRPNDTISGAEVCATIARSEKLAIPETPLEGIDADAWYAGSLSAVQTAGLLDGVQLDPERAIFREDAMQIFANLLVRRGKTMPDEKQTAKTLAKFADTYQLSENRRAAAALCVQEGLIQGSGNRLTPRSSFTRAEFAKLLTLIQK